MECSHCKKLGRLQLWAAYFDKIPLQTKQKNMTKVNFEIVTDVSTETTVF